MTLITILGFIFLVIFSISATLLFIIWVHQLWYGIKTDRIVFFPTSLQKVDKDLLRLVPKYISNTEQVAFVELGCGTGHVLRFMNQNFKWNKLVGVELDFMTNWIAKKLTKASNVQIFQKDIFAYQIPPQSLVYCFLGSEILDKLHEKGQFENNLVFSLEFPLTNILSTEVIKLEGFSFQKNIYVYDFRKIT